MCGLIGYSGASEYNTDKLKFIMLLNSIDRGGDATGFYNIPQGLVKSAENAKIFLPKTPIQNSDFFIGHVRAKTVGLNSDENAHPFSFNTTVLAHNGTLTNHHSLLHQYGLNGADFNVDSQMLAGILNVSMGNSPYENYDPLEYFKPITEIVGAAALLFKDKRDIAEGRDSRLFAYRNSDRPLCYGFDVNSNMYISSIETPLESLGLTNITSFDVNTVYEIENGEIISETVLPRKDSVETFNVNLADKMFDFFTGGLFTTDYYDLPGTYIQFSLTKDICEKYKLTKFTTNKLYFVEDIDYDSLENNSIPMNVIVWNDANVKVSVPVFAFNLLYSKFTYSGYVKALTNVTGIKNHSKLCDFGDILLVHEEAVEEKKTGKKTIGCKMINCKDSGVDKNTSFLFETTWIRPLTLTEVETYLESKKKELPPVKPQTYNKKKTTKIPPIVDIVLEYATTNLLDLSKEEIEENPILGKLNLTSLDLVDNVCAVKEEVDDLTLFLIKVLEKKKYALDNNLFSFNDLKPHLIKIYEQLCDSTNLKLISNTLNEIDND